jgi:uncharacterized membrane protein
LVALALAGVGLAVAAYLTYVHYTGVAPVCAIAHGCEQVQTSRWSEVAGIPVALVGLLGYAAILVSLVAPGESGRLALVGCGFSAYLTYREVFTIRAICAWCVASAVILTALAVLTTALVLRAAPADG